MVSMLHSATPRTGHSEARSDKHHVLTTAMIHPPPTSAVVHSVPATAAMINPTPTAAATRLDLNDDMFVDINIADFGQCDIFLPDQIWDNDEQIHFDKGQIVVGPMHNDGQVIEVVGDERVVINDGGVMVGDGGEMVDSECAMHVQAVGGRAMGGDGGAMVVDGEAMVGDEGAMVGDGWATIVGVGGKVVDGGAKDVDGGAKVVDGGAKLVDGGAKVVDGGAKVVDGGAKVLDGEATVGGRGVTFVDGEAMVGGGWATIVDVGANAVDGWAIVGDRGVMVDGEGAVVEDERATVVVGNMTVGDGDAAVAGGCAIRQQILELSPIPKAAPRARNRQAQVAQLLTGSPYKDALEEKVRLRGVGRRGASKGRTTGRGRRPSSSTATSANTVSRIRTRGGIATRARGPRTRGGSMAVPSRANEDQVGLCRCIYCHEVYQEPPTEDWLQCAECTKWFHESCGNGFNICDICDV